MIKSLRSTQVFICDNLIDRKDLAKLLLCSVDKAKSLKRDFCYGASLYTANPFGCHRISIRYLYKPWYSFCNLKNNEVIINKNKILEVIKADLQQYRWCPYLNLTEIWNNFLLLPSKISLEDTNFAIIETEDGEIEVLPRWDYWSNTYKSYKYLKNEYGKRLLSKE